VFVAVENVIDEAVNDRRLSYGLITEKDDLVFEQRRNGALRKIEIADVCHIRIQKIIRYHQKLLLLLLKLHLLPPHLPLFSELLNRFTVPSLTQTHFRYLYAPFLPL